MRCLRSALGALVLLCPSLASAQLDAPVRDPAGSAIVVTGKRLTPEGKPIPMSEWRVAETEHVLFYARADDKQVARVARNLERLHFLLSVLLNRIDKPDDAIKLSVTQIGDSADFRNLHLGHARWQEGPFPIAFPAENYYDPRDDGPVLATTRNDQRIILQPGIPLASVPIPPELTGETRDSATGSTGLSNTPLSATIQSMKVNEIAFDATAESRLYSGFAQNYLLTYFPAAYPRWYLDGFGEMFATFDSSKDGILEYGRAPDGFVKVMEWYGRYRLGDLLSGKYLTERKSQTDWTPYHAWALVHLLFFSDAWRQPLHEYLASFARGAPPAEAAAALGDIGKLEHQWASYRGSKVPYETLTYPAGRFGGPLVRQLTRDQADFLKRRLVLGARVAIPAPRFAGDTGPSNAVRDRAAWLDDLARDAAAAPDRFDLQLLLAEGACRSDAFAQCRLAADRALAIAPTVAPALAWKGLALADLAAVRPEPERGRMLTEARSAIARANRADTEATLPLLAYYRSFRDCGSPPPDLAVLGLVKALNSVPAASSTRLFLGEALAARGAAAEARQTLLPVAIGAHVTSERAAAADILHRIGSKSLNPAPRRVGLPGP